MQQGGNCDNHEQKGYAGVKDKIEVIKALLEPT